MATESSQLTAEIKAFANSISVDLFGITKAIPPSTQAERHVRSFIEQNREGEMTYLKKLPDTQDPKALLPEAKSIIIIGLNYYQQKPETPPSEGRIARYAHGRDYHKVLKATLKKIENFLLEKIPNAKTRICVDSAPIMEKYYAEQAGLGFIGKNTTLINPKIGSFFVLGELLTDQEFNYNKPISGTCGECTRCLDSCPTKALTAPCTMDARKCISYLTIEKKGEISPDLAAKMKNQIFGCDICQEVCPYNKAHARQTQNSDFNNPIAGHSIPLREIEQIKTDEQYTARFAGSPLMRAKRTGLQRNARIAKFNMID